MFGAYERILEGLPHLETDYSVKDLTGVFHRVEHLRWVKDGVHFSDIGSESRCRSDVAESCQESEAGSRANLTRWMTA